MINNLIPENVKKWEELSGIAPWRILRFPDLDDPRWSAFNPSIAFSDVLGYWILFRSSNYFLDPTTASAVLTTNENRVRTRLWMAKLDETMINLVEDSITELDYSTAGIDFKRGPEDGRLYWVDNGWEFTAGLLEPSVPLPRIARFKIIESKVELMSIYTAGELYDIEKNWVGTTDASGNFEYIYNPVSVYVDSVGPKKVRDVSDGIRHVRGGTQLIPLPSGEYLSVIHEAVVKEKYIYIPRHFAYKTVRVRKYFHKFAKYDNNGRIIGLSDPFTFTDARIEFAAGLAIKDKTLFVSYGHQDVASYLAKIDLNKALEMINDI